MLEECDSSYVSRYRILAYDLDWAVKHATRSGYLFMGTPNERSIAQPPREFYIYFPQPYNPPDFTDEGKPCCNRVSEPASPLSMLGGD